MRPTLLAFLAWLAGSGPALAAPPGCRGALSGSVKATFECTVTVRPGAEGMVVLDIQPVAEIPDLPSCAPGSFEIPEPPSPGTYTLDQLGMGRATVAAKGGTLYVATKTSSQRGEVQVTFTSVRPDPKSKGGFLVQGTYRARLIPAGGGKSGEVVIEVEF